MIEIFDPTRRLLADVERARDNLRQLFAQGELLYEKGAGSGGASVEYLSFARKLKLVRPPNWDLLRDALLDFNLGVTSLDAWLLDAQQGRGLEAVERLERAVESLEAAHEMMLAATNALWGKDELAQLKALLPRFMAAARGYRPAADEGGDGTD